MSTFVAIPIQRSALNDYRALARNFRDAESGGSRIERAVLLTKDGPYMVRGFGVSQLKGEVTFDKGRMVYDDEPASVKGSISLTTQTRPIIPRVFGSIGIMLSGVGSLALGSILVTSAAHAATGDLTTQIAGGIAAVIAGAVSIGAYMTSASKWQDDNSSANDFCRAIEDASRKTQVFNEVSTH